jgi:hypothetical protein
MAGNSEVDKVEHPDPRTTFEEFTAGAAWRALPLKIKLMVVHLWRAERDVPPKPNFDD